MVTTILIALMVVGILLHVRLDHLPKTRRMLDEEKRKWDERRGRAKKRGGFRQWLLAAVLAYAAGGLVQRAMGVGELDVPLWIVAAALLLFIYAFLVSRIWQRRLDRREESRATADRLCDSIRAA